MGQFNTDDRYNPPPNNLFDSLNQSEVQSLDQINVISKVSQTFEAPSVVVPEFSECENCAYTTQ